MIESGNKEQQPRKGKEMDKKDNQHPDNTIPGEKETDCVLSGIRGKTLFSEIVGGTPNDPCYGTHLPGIVIDVNGNSTWIAVTSPDDDLTRFAVKMLLEVQRTKQKLKETEAHLDNILHETEQLGQRLKVTEHLVEKLQRALSDASTVVDKGEDENYAYQGELEEARSFLDKYPHDEDKGGLSDAPKINTTPKKEHE